MKIGILISELAPYGAERVTIRLAQGLKKRGVDVIILLTDGSPSIEVEGISLVPMLRGYGGLSLTQKLFYAPVQYIRLYRVIKREKIDILISFMERANIFNIILPGKYRRITSVRDFMSRSIKSRHFIKRLSIKLFYRLFKNRPDLWVGVSKATSSDLTETFGIDPVRVDTMYNPLDLEMVTDLAREQLEDKYRDLLKGNSILHVGRIDEQKGHWYLLRAFWKVLETLPDAKLILLGDGELRGYVESLASDMGIREKVHFLGVQNNPFKFMSRASVFSLSSQWEGLPNVLIEALSCKAAIVAVDCKSGPREILAPETDPAKVAQEIEKAQYGILVPPFDGQFKDAESPLTKEESMLAEALLILLQDNALRQHYKQSCLERVETFEMSNIIEQWMDLLKNL
ncbi:MAG: glycosyltransferase [Planctomycetota bacterium]|jgi:glycosyltransferase involved in cell wall biosynthesis